jgi:hypothetical protein
MVRATTLSSSRRAAAAAAPPSIEHHLTAIYRKLGLRSRTQLAALVAEEEHADRSGPGGEPRG